MQKQYKSRQVSDLRDVNDVWGALEVVHNYLDKKFGENSEVYVKVTDVRGEAKSKSLAQAKAGWEKDRDALEGIYTQRQNAQGFSATVTAYFLDSDSRILQPQIVILTEGADSGEVRGTAAEAHERAERFLAEREAERKTTEAAQPPPTSKWHAFLENPWVKVLAAPLFVALVVLAITLILT